MEIDTAQKPNLRCAVFLSRYSRVYGDEYQIFLSLGVPSFYLDTSRVYGDEVPNHRFFILRAVKLYLIYAHNLDLCTLEHLPFIMNTTILRSFKKS